jgi:Tfp pilus assembly protein PilZ
MPEHVDGVDPRNGSRVDLIFEDNAVSPQFAVGLDLYFEIRQRQRRVRVKSNMLGWYRPNVLITTAPILDGRQMTTPIGAEIVVRYMLEGSVYGFVTRLVQKYQNPINMWLLGYPELIEVKSLRQSPRVQMYLQVKDSEENAWMLMDLSLHGALLSVNADWKIGDAIFLNFTLPNGEKIEQLRGEVVRVHHTREERTVGVLFDKEDQVQLAKIREYVESCQLPQRRLTTEFDIPRELGPET